MVEIGENCGYIFQLLNDLGPFSAMQSNFDYKGRQNIDVDRNRKSIVVAYIFGAATSKEKKSLSSLTGEPLQDLILQLYLKYSVYDAVCQEAKCLEQTIDEQITDIQRISRHTSCIEDFRFFVHEVISLCFLKVALTGAGKCL